MVTIIKKEYYYWRTLHWINKIRKQCGLDKISSIRTGKINHVYSCPVAQSLKSNTELGIYDTVATHRWCSRLNYKIYNHPTYVGKFIDLVDKGEYPQLVT